MGAAGGEREDRSRRPSRWVEEEEDVVVVVVMVMMGVCAMLVDGDVQRFQGLEAWRSLALACAGAGARGGAEIT